MHQESVNRDKHYIQIVYDDKYNTKDISMQKNLNYTFLIV